MDVKEDGSPNCSVRQSPEPSDEATNSSASSKIVTLPPLDNSETRTDQERDTSGQSQGLGGDDMGIGQGASGGADSGTGRVPVGSTDGTTGVGGDLSKRERTYTDKGHEYFRVTKMSAFRSAVSSWHATAAAANRALTDTQDVSELQELRNSLENKLLRASSICHDMVAVVESDEMANAYKKLDQLEENNLALLKRLTDHIREIQYEANSEKSKKSTSSKGSRSSKASVSSCRSGLSQHSKVSRVSSSSARAEAAAEAAALKTKLKYFEAEATKKKELELLQAQVQLEVANAKLQAIEAVEEPGYHAGISMPLDPTAHEFVPAHHVKKEEPSEQESMAVLAKSLAEQMYINRLPVPEPTKFTGDPLTYPSWRASFQTLIGSRGINPAERIHYLRRYLGGAAKEAVEGFLLLASDNAYDKAMNLLERRYGDSFIIAGAFRDKIETWPKIEFRDGKALQRLSDFLHQCSVAMIDNPSLAVLNDDRENQKILDKLPNQLVDRWGRIVQRSRRHKRVFPSFNEFVRFLEEEAEIANDPVTSLPSRTSESKSRDKSGSKPKERPDKRQAGNFKVETTETSMSCEYCDLSSHQTDKCRKFMRINIKEREKFIMERGLCFGCLVKGHRSRECTSRLTCATCSKKHPTCLHSEPKDNDTKPQVQKPEEVVDSKAHTGMSASGSGTAKTSMIIPVWLSHKTRPNHEVQIYAMLDTQSDTTFILDSTLARLGAKSTKVRLLLSTLSASNEAVDSSRIEGLVIRGLDSYTSIPLPVTYSRGLMPVDRSHIPCPDVARQWSHLEHIAENLSPLKDCEVGLLVGYNCPRALAPREVIAHEDSGPYAQRTDLGWGIVGITDPQQIEGDAIGTSHRVLARPQPLDSGPTRASSCIVLRSSIKELVAPPIPAKYELNTGDIIRIMERDFSESDDTGDQKLSQEDMRFLEIMEKGIQLQQDGHYQMPLPLKHAYEDTNLPNNRSQAVKRLDQLKKKLVRNAVLHAAYTNFMDKAITLGHAEKVPEDELKSRAGKVWYVPHHSVQHPKKPDKVRVVFDCSARHGGVSLNDKILQGPDLTNKLIGVLARFRQEPVAITCDVEGMFHQFRVEKDHRDFLRFLWWEDGKLDSVPTEYRMAVHLFGAVSSPACATYALRQIAADNDGYKSDVTEFIRRDFYVDDGLKSVKDVQTAIRIALSSTELCAKGGLRLHKFLSNSRQVLQAIPAEERAGNTSSLNLMSDDLPAERVLGVHWNVKEDTLGFEIQLQHHQPLTRRGILSVVSSLYDPLGLAAPVVLVGKQILQDLCRETLGWDDPLPDQIKPRWELWKSELSDLDRLNVARCYKPADFGEVSKAELHHFADASFKGYGVSSYLRLVNHEGRVHCSLVMAKARVTPLKVTTVPRLELTAAVTAVRLSQLLQRELSCAVSSHNFWTDSKVVLGYIANEASRFHIFVANRVQEIRSASSPTQWRHVSTDQNPADLASRGCSVRELIRSSLWVRGPEMLWQTQVPNGHPVEGLNIDDPEVRKRCLMTASKPSPSVLSALERYSSWIKMRRVVALCQNIKQVLARKLRPENITMADMKAAEEVIIKLVQRESFGDELRGMKAQNNTKQNSHIHKLDPFIDTHGILRVGGRLKQSGLSFSEKHPVLLPKAHHVTEVILYHHHKHTAHQGRGMVINALRSSGYWVVGASRSVARMIAQCVTCRRLRSEAGVQKMASLPIDRVQPSAPFTHTGMDYFGPFYIKEGRKELKRWGVIFTCMASRAVHLEVACTLSTDGFLNVLRRFISIRGAVQQLRSDRGTNFVGAANELKTALQEIKDESVRRYLTKHSCEFVFNPPNASHMGGVWERQIKTTRSILTALLKEHGTQLEDDSLRTLMAETSAIMNNRPLTVENVNDPTSATPITPNHLLTMKTSIVVPPPGNFQQADMYSRKRWRRVQHLANVFWARWRKEFLHNLQQRQKWNRPQRNFLVGDVVLLKDTDMPRGLWKLARVCETQPGDDGYIRKVKVIVGDSSLDNKGKRRSPVAYLERPIHKLVLLLEAGHHTT